MSNVDQELEAELKRLENENALKKQQPGFVSQYGLNFFGYIVPWWVIIVIILLILYIIWDRSQAPTPTTTIVSPAPVAPVVVTPPSPGAFMMGGYRPMTDTPDSIRRLLNV